MVSIRVWDLPLRLFHWSLVLLVTVSVVTGQFGSDLGLQAAQWHKLSGYAVLTLLLFRLAWGFVGGTYARFRSFVRGPRSVLDYVAELRGRRVARRRLGHNPLGGWSTVTLLLTLLLQAGTGLFIADEDLGLEGPLAKYVGGRTADWLNGLHEANVTLLLLLIALHLAAITFYLFAKRENLIRPMLTGVKHLPAPPDDAPASGGHPLLALVLLLGVTAVVWYVANRL